MVIKESEKEPDTRDMGPLKPSQHSSQDRGHLGGTPLGSETPQKKLKALL